MTHHRKSREEQEFDDAFDERGQLRDGITRVRVPVRMIDSAGDLPQGKCESTHDAVAVYIRARQLQDRCPGFTPSSSLRTAKLNALYDQLDADLAEQWKAKPPTGAGSRGPRGQQEGDLCTIDGSPGRLKEIDGELRCVSDRKPRGAESLGVSGAQEIYDPAKGAVRRHGDAQGHAALMDGLYSERDRELSEQWRNPR